MTTTQDAKVSSYASQIITEIRRDIASGQVPATAASFSELHDYVDANEYLIQLFPDAAFGEAQMAFENEILDEVDARIKSGALAAA